MTEPDVRIVLVTGPDAAVLESIGRVLVEERLAACVNVIPGVTSVYRWEGAVQADSEAVAMIKTTQARVADTRSRIVTLHPYDVPEFVVLDVSYGSPEYVRWVRESVGIGGPDVET